MKMLMMSLAASCSLLTGCIAVPVADGPRVSATVRSDDHYHGHYRYDRDQDGVPNRYDRRPNNPYRY